jgi:hypothetical protein
MTLREAVAQAQLELGISRERAELGAKLSDGVFPDAATLTNCPVRPGYEREFIEFLKHFFRQMDAHPEATQAELRRRMANRTKAN